MLPPWPSRGGKKLRTINLYLEHHTMCAVKFFFTSSHSRCCWSKRNNRHRNLVAYKQSSPLAMQKCVAVETGFVSFSELAKEVGGVARATARSELLLAPVRLQTGLRLPGLRDWVAPAAGAHCLCISTQCQRSPISPLWACVGGNLQITVRILCKFIEQVQHLRTTLLANNWLCPFWI